MSNKYMIDVKLFYIFNHNKKFFLIENNNRQAGYTSYHEQAIFRWGVVKKQSFTQDNLVYICVQQEIIANEKKIPSEILLIMF